MTSTKAVIHVCFPDNLLINFHILSENKISFVFPKTILFCEIKPGAGYSYKRTQAF